MATSRFSPDLIHYARDFFYWPDPYPAEKTFHDQPEQNHKGIQTVMREDTNSIAYQLLESTDWYVLRKVERGIDIPEDVAEYRANVISICEQRRTRIMAATNTQNFYETCSDFSDLLWPKEININKT